MDEIRVKSMSDIEHELKNIKNELHQMNIFMGHICQIFDSLIANDVIIKAHTPSTDKLDTNSTLIPGA